MLDQFEQKFLKDMAKMPNYPVDQWNPEYCGELPIRIDHQGQWHSSNDPQTPMTPIRRDKIVQLMSKLLWVEDNNAQLEYFLKTPVEKIKIQVDDVPFIIDQFEFFQDGQTKNIRFHTSVGDWVNLTSEHPIEIRPFGQPAVDLPYVHLRFGLYGRLNRNTFYQLIEETLALMEPRVPLSQTLKSFVHQLETYI